MKRFKEKITCVIVEPEPFTCVIIEPKPINLTCVIIEPKPINLTCKIIEPKPINLTCRIIEPEPITCRIIEPEPITCRIIKPKPAGFTCLLIPPKPARLVLYVAPVFKTMYVWGAYKNVDQLWRGTPTCDLSTIVNVHETALNIGVVTKTKECGFLVNHEKLLNWKAKKWSFDLSNLRSILNTDLTQIKKTAKMFDLIPGITRKVAS